jgi:E3 ubiquitin-protein ligase RNF5
VDYLDREDPTIPSRPAGQRPAPLRDPNAPHFFGGRPMRGTTYSTGNFAISAGFGVFPGLFGVTFVSAFHPFQSVD